MKVQIILVLMIAVLTGCTNSSEKKKPIVADTVSRVAVPKKAQVLSQQDSIAGAGQEILSFLKSNNHEGLTRYFSANGVVFSPYGFIDSAKSKKLTSEDFLVAMQKKWLLTWGSFDGTGEPIKLTVTDYLKKFVYNADYLHAEAEGYDQVVKQGNSLNNLNTVFPNSHFIDYHFSGFAEKNKGMDWTSLRLVFHKENNDYYLVAVVHDQWTI